MEARRDGPGRPFAEYYTRTPTHIWTYDLQDKRLTEVATRDRMAVFYTPQLLLDDERMLVQVFRNQAGQIFSMNLDGSDAREFTAAGEGLPYGFSLNRERRRVAFHLASPKGYQIWTSDFEGRRRILVRGPSGPSLLRSRLVARTVNGSPTRTAVSGKIRATTGPMCASAAPTDPSSGC